MRKEKGFTLIELVMVIVIIGILAAVAIPRFVSLRDDAQQSACDGNVGALRSALSAFYAKSAVDNLMTTGGFPATTGTGINSLDTTTNRHAEDFVQGTIPTCPRSGSTYAALGVYVYSATTSEGLVNRHVH